VALLGVCVRVFETPVNQIENFGMHLNVDGTVVYVMHRAIVFLKLERVTHVSSSYGMKIEAILDRPADNICLDHLARVLVDVHQVREDG
jgi:hypothetical protein